MVTGPGARRGAHVVDHAIAPKHGRVDLAVALNGFPRLSETFVLHELLELERQGLRLHVTALRRPDEIVQQEALGRMQADVEYLPAAAAEIPRLALRVAHATLFMRRPLGYLDGLAEVLSSPDFSRGDLRRALLLAHRLVRLGCPPLYVHFAHKPATVGRFASLLAGVPYALSAHAKDIWLTPPRELARKIRDARVVLTCTSEGASYLAELAGGRTPIALAYHGVETGGRSRRRGSSGGPPVVLTVGRLVEKKGHETLLRAAALVRDRGHEFQLRIAGEGPEWSRLQRLVHTLDLGERVAFLGPLREAEIRREYEQADLFALACQELENGDRDGIPNVVLEAMAHGLPVVSTACPGVAEALVDGESALLAAQRDVEGFAGRLEQLIADRELRDGLGTAARARAVARFDRDANLPTVLAALRDALHLEPLSRAVELDDESALRAVA